MPQNSVFQDKFVLICEEAEICKRLSSNDINVRRKGVSALKQLLKNIDNRKVVDSTDFSRLWNGIFNFIWMSDKLLIQEEDVESISKLIHVLKTHEMLFVREFFVSLANQWNRISHFRTDKFLMMVRRFLRQILFLLKNSAWNSQKIESFSKELYSAIQILPLGLVLHLNDIYIEEIAKVSEGSIPTNALILLLKGYVECIVAMKPSMNIVNHINSNIFSGLTKQLKLHIKQNAVLAVEDEWKDNENEDEVISELPENRTFDPRPGNVDVYLPFIEFDEKEIVEFLQQYEKKKVLPSKVRNILSQIINMFESITKLRESVYNPKKVMIEVYNKTNKRKRRSKSFGSIIKKSCKRLEMFEAESNNVVDDKVFKKLDKMNDLIQIPVGKKLVTVKKKKLVSSKNKKLRKKIARAEHHTWVITENIEKSSLVDSCPKSQWTINDYVHKEDTSNISSDTSQDMELVLSSSAVEEKSCSVSPTCKRQLVENTYDSSPLTKLVGVEISNNDLIEIMSQRRKLSEEKSEFEINTINTSKIMSQKISTSSTTDNRIYDEVSLVNNTSFGCSTSSPKKLSRKRENEKSYDGLLKTRFSPSFKIHSLHDSPQEINRKNGDELDIENTMKSPKKIANERKSETSINSCFTKCRTANSNKLLKIEEKKSLNNDSLSCITRSRLLQNLEDNVVENDAKIITRSFPDIISPVLEMKNLSTVEENEVHVSPSSNMKVVKKFPQKTESNKRQILTSSSPVWITVPNDKLISWLPKDEKECDDNKSDEDVDYDISALFASPQQKSAQKRRRSSRPVVVQEVKRSARLANKAAAAKIGDDKKVAFTRNNSFQEVREYYSTLRSRPKNPYDASKTPVKGILKPFAVPGPINPFYFSNGQPKLLNLRKQRAHRFL